MRIETRNRIVLENLGLAKDFAYRFAQEHNCLHLLGDLTQESILGLIRAVEKFDPGFGCTLSTYAYPWIKVKQSRYSHRDGRSTIGISTKAQKRFNALWRAIDNFVREFQRLPTTEEELIKAGLKRKILVEISRNPFPIVISLDEPIDKEDGRKRTLMDIIPVSNGLDFVEEIISADLWEKFKEKVSEFLLDNYRERDAKIVMARLGLSGNGCRPKLATIGKEHKLTRERIRQIVKGFLENPNFHEFLEEQFGVMITKRVLQNIRRALRAPS